MFDRYFILCHKWTLPSHLSSGKLVLLHYFKSEGLFLKVLIKLNTLIGMRPTETDLKRLRQSIGKAYKSLSGEFPRFIRMLFPCQVSCWQEHMACKAFLDPSVNKINLSRHLFDSRQTTTQTNRCDKWLSIYKT